MPHKLAAYPMEAAADEPAPARPLVACQRKESA